MKSIIHFLFLITCTPIFCQYYELSGTILNQDDNPIAIGDLFLFDHTNKLVKSTIVANGTFKFDTMEIGEYELVISCLGYEKETQKVKLDQNKILTIKLQESIVSLDEVTIKEVKSNIKMENGNLKVVIENSIFESLAAPIDVLSKLPGLQISPDQESILVIGRGTPLIYLDNQKIDIDQLKSLSVEEIKDIEIIDNPSAKYEAEGRSLIRITRKQDSKDGYTINISEVASFKRRFSNYAGLTTRFKENALELRANVNYNTIGFWESLDSNLSVPLQNIETLQQTQAIGPRPQLIMGGGFFYRLTSNDYISGQVNYRTQKDRFPIVTNSILRVDQIEDFVISESQNEAPRSFLSSNINFNKTLSTNNTLFLGTQYTNYKRDLNSIIANNTNQNGFEQFQNREQQFQVNSLAIRMDLEKKLNKKTTFEIGGSLSLGKAKAFSDFEFLNPIGRLTSNYDYKEDIYASYAQVSGNISKLNYSIGLRTETNIVKGGFRDNQELLVNRNQTRAFPKIKINIALDSTKTISLHYNTTINRPGYLNASSISTFINPLVEFTRNVNLKPTITEELSTNLQYKKTELYISYFKTKNPVFYSSLYDSSRDRIISSPQNLKQESGYSIRLRNTKTYTFWTTTNSFTLNYSKIEDTVTLIQKTRPYLYYYSNNEFRLFGKTSLGINLWGFTKRYQGAFERNSIFNLGASLSKTF